MAEGEECGSYHLISFSGIVRILSFIFCLIAFVCALLYDSNTSFPIFIAFDVITCIFMVYCFMDLLIRILDVIDVDIDALITADIIISIIAAISLISIAAVEHSIFFRYSTTVLKISIISAYIAGFCFMANAIYRVC